MIKEIEKTSQYYKNSKKLSSLTPIKQKNKVNHISNKKFQKKELYCKKMLKIKNLSKSFIRKFISNINITNQINKETNELKLLKDKDKKDININYNHISPKNKNPGNNKSNNLFLINNSSSNIFDLTTETSLNLNNYSTFKRKIPAKKNINININKDNNNKYKTNNNKISDKFKTIENNRKSITPLKDITRILKEKNNAVTIKKIMKNEKIPGLIISINKIRNDYIIPLRKEYTIKNSNSNHIKNIILKLRNKILESNKELNIKRKNKSFINLNSKKNLSILFIQKAHSLINCNEINGLKNDINKINEEINKTKEETILFKDNYLKIYNEVKSIENEINNKKKIIEDFLEVKNNIKTMIILLHKRITDVKERIKRNDEKKEYLKKYWYELSLKYNKI